MDLREVYAAYKTIAEDEKYGYDKDGNSLNPKDKGKKKKKDTTKNKDEKWQDSDGDGKWYEEGEDVKKEAIEFAADYFLEEGIEEEELDIIIEDVGLDDFVEFVFEERAARKARASAPSYAKVKASVDASDAAKKKAKKGEYSAAYKKKETDVTDYGDDKPAKVSVKKVKKAVAKTKAAKPAAKPAPKAAKPAAKKAPEKKAPEKKAGLISKIGSAYKKGVERHKAARAKGKVPEKRVKEFGKGFASGVKDTVKFAGKVKKAVVGETLLALLDTLEEGAELDKFDAVLAYLIDEEIAEDFDAANEVMIKLNESLVDEIFEQQKKLIAWDNYSSRLVWEDMNKGYTVTAADKKGNTPAWQGYKAGKKKKDGTPLYKAADHLNKEGYQRNPEKGEAEERKRSKRVRGERTPMPPRGDKRREDFEKWYAANVR
mgnify:CR=1 FL=1